MPSSRVPLGAGVVIAAVLWFLGTAVPAGAADGSDGAGWSAAPVAGSGAGERPHFYLEAGPGAVLEDTVTITNRGDQARTYDLRGAGGNGEWIAPAERRVTVPARTRAEVPFTVTVPQDATPGNHPGAVTVTAGEREVSIRVHLRVTGAALAALTVEGVSIHGGEIRYTLVNRGNTALTPRLAVRADGTFGPLFQRGARALDVKLPPGQRVTRTESWPDPPALDRATVELTVTARNGAKDTASVTYTAVSGAALALLGVAVGAALAAGGALWWVRRGRRGPDGVPDQESGQESGQGADEVAGDDYELAATGTGAAK